MSGDDSFIINKKCHDISVASIWWINAKLQTERSLVVVTEAVTHAGTLPWQKRVNLDKMMFGITCLVRVIVKF